MISGVQARDCVDLFQSIYFARDFLPSLFLVYFSSAAYSTSLTSQFVS